MRTCCGADDHKDHDPDCEYKKELDRKWKEKQRREAKKDVQRSSNSWEEPINENSQRRDRKR